MGLHLSAQTVRNRLSGFGLKGRVARKTPLISVKNRKKRLQWARDHSSWEAKDWRKVLWSDESKFNMFGSDGLVYIRRRVGEEYHPRCTVRTVKHGGGNIMVWGAFSGLGPGPLVRIEGTMDKEKYKDILQNSMLPYFNRHKRGRAGLREFQQDNDPKHTAKIVKDWFQAKKIKQMDWPPQSPDLNPIENMWWKLESERKGQNPKNPNELFTILQEAWKKISPDYIDSVITSMPKRCARVIQARGYAIKY